MISDTVYSFIFDPCFVRTLNSPRRSEKYKLFLINSEYLKIVLKFVQYEIYPNEAKWEQNGGEYFPVYSI